MAQVGFGGLGSAIVLSGGSSFDVVNVIFTIIGFAIETVYPFLLENKILLAGVVLLLLAIIIEIINGLLDLVVYTAVIGGFSLVVVGGILYLI